MKAEKPNSGKKKIMLALQGGGAHTAYVWGVLDRLLENDEIEVVALSGTSGGALIGAVVAYGLSCRKNHNDVELDDAGRRSFTRELLDKLWSEVSMIGDAFWNPYRFVSNPFHPSWNIDGLPIPVALNALSLITSPYQLLIGPRENPVKMALTDCIRLNVLNHSDIGPELYVCATNVRTNQPKIFTRRELEFKHLLASACLPVVDRAVKIGADYYWDGGYVADPALAPLIEHHSTVTGDLVIVGVNPIVTSRRAGPPDTAWEIIDRMNEITFNSSFISEIKRIHSTNELIRLVPDDALAKQEGGPLYGKHETLIHYIPPHAEIASYGVASKSNTAWPFLKHLKSLGRQVAERWLRGATAGGGAPLLGIQSDTNLKKLFIDPYHWKSEPLPAEVQSPLSGAVTKPEVVDESISSNSSGGSGAENRNP